MKTRNTPTGWNATTTGSNHTNNNNLNQVIKGDTLWKLDGSKDEVNITAEEEMQLQSLLKKRYYDTHYNERTGIRIAGTLGGFFLLVLLTLLYKSHCKKHSREPSPVPPLDLSQLPQSTALFNNVEHSGSEDGENPHLIPLFGPSHFINMNQIHPYNHHPMPNNNRYVTSPAVLLTAANSSSSEEDLSIGSWTGDPLGQPLRPHPPPTKMKWLQQNNIDIHVILPTPTISPSGSEHFHNHCNNNNNHSGMIPIPPPQRRRGGVGLDRDRSSSVGSNSLSSCASGGGGGGANAFFFLDNLKYMDDTDPDTEFTDNNIPNGEENGEDTRSIGSDSVFACFEHNFDHVAAPSCFPGGEGGGGGGRRISSVSGSSGVTCALVRPFTVQDDDGEVAMVTVTEAQAQVHHRDSFCSELEINEYMESSRRRSSSTQTTFSDLQQCLSIAGSASGGCSPRLSPRLFLRQGSGGAEGLSPRLFVRQGSGGSRRGAGGFNPTPTLLTVGPPQVGGLGYARKRSFDALRKAYSLQCDEGLRSGSGSGGGGNCNNGAGDSSLPSTNKSPNKI